MKHVLLIAASLIYSLLVSAQPLEQLVKIIVTPDHSSWNYRIGEPSYFTVTVLQNGVTIKNVKINYQVGPERMKPYKQETVNSNEGVINIKGGTLDKPGFLRCIVTTEVEGKQYRGLATVSYSAEQIQPTVSAPADFESFWQKAKDELALVPLDAKMTLMPERSTANTNVYHVNLQSYGNSRLYGILCVPKKEGKYPAIVQLPGAGIRPYFPDLEVAEKGVIVFTIGIHGIPVTMDPAVYNDLNAGALKGYFFFNADNKDRFYYKRVYMGCVRAVDLIFSLPQFDGDQVAVSGNSQGGALSVVTAALDSRIKYYAAIHPALCDLTGYFYNRAGGWPHFFAESNLWFTSNPSVKESLSYFDVVNFAKRIKVKGYFTWGYNDETCPPTSIYAAYNTITAPKKLAIFQETGHWVYPEQKMKFTSWLLNQFEK